MVRRKCSMIDGTRLPSHGYTYSFFKMFIRCSQNVTPQKRDSSKLVTEGALVGNKFRLKKIL